MPGARGRDSRTANHGMQRRQYDPNVWLWPTARCGFYSPFMPPYLTNVNTSTSIQFGIKYVTDTFTVSYLLSVFEASITRF